jgi:ribosomal protein L25 (general stress protein Ctc)
MKTIEVKAQNRTGLGTGQAKTIRKGGLIPCIVYGNGETVHFSTAPLEIRDLIYTNEFRKANINLDGKTVECIVKEVQYHPVTDAILHVDFQTLSAGKLVKVNADGTDFEFAIANSLEIDIEPCDLLFIDTVHTKKHCLAELDRHAKQAQKYIVLHDPTEWPGVFEAVITFLNYNHNWHIIEHCNKGSGLLVLERYA